MLRQGLSLIPASPAQQSHEFASKIVSAICLVATMTLVMLAGNAAILGLGSGVIISCMIGALFYFGYYLYTRLHGTTPRVATVFAISSTLVLDPIWLTNGGTTGPGIFAFFVLAPTIVPAIGKRSRATLVVLTLLNVGLFFLFERTWPELVVPYPSADARYIDLFITFAACLVAITVIVNYSVDHYQEQRDEARAAYQAGRIAREEMQKAFAAIESAPTPMIAVGKDGIDYVNPAAVRLWGYQSSSEMKAVPFLELFTESSRGRVREIQEQVSAMGYCASPQSDVQGRDVSGRLFNLEYRVTALHTADGTHVGHTGSWVDVTSKIALENERKRMQSQLLHSEKLASIGTLAAGVAHEINNPLAIIKMTIAHIRDQVEKGGVQGLEIRQLERQDLAVDRCSTIVRGLRTYARADDDVLEMIDLQVAIKETLSLFGEIYRKAGVTIEMKLEASDHHVYGNYGKIQQVLMNLLNNAKDALTDTADARIWIKTHDEGERIAMAVTDNGTGIDPKHLETVFDPFFTTKAQGHGTGLGLAISQGIIQSCGGKIEVQSALGTGTTFKILFLGAAQILAVKHSA